MVCDVPAGVAGFPEGHVESKAALFEPTESELVPATFERLVSCAHLTMNRSRAPQSQEADVARLKAKIDAGASFVVCQFVFEASRWRR